VPLRLLNWVGGRKKAGFIGIFISGLFVGVFAAPCIGPPIVALLTLVGKEANPFQGFVVFFVLSLGLGFPYLILGTFSGLLGNVPRSGEWMIWIKRLFGVVLLALSAFYFSLALYPGFALYVVPVAFGLGGFYLGFVNTSGNKNFVFRRFKQAFGVISILIAIMILFWKPSEGVVWEPYSEEKLDLAIEEGKPVVIDFSAEWCLTCHELEHFTFTDSGVIEALESVARLGVDLTNPNTEEAFEAITRFDILGVPTVIFFNADGKEIIDSRITGYVSPEEFLDLLSPAVEASEERPTI